MLPDIKHVIIACSYYTLSGCSQAACGWAITSHLKYYPSWGCGSEIELQEERGTSKSGVHFLSKGRKGGGRGRRKGERWKMKKEVGVSVLLTCI